MRERIIDDISRKVRKELPDGHAYGREELQAAGIPPGIRHFLLKTLDRRSTLEAADILDVRSDWFDASDSGFREALQLAVHRLRETARFPAQEWPRAVPQAVDQVLDYVIDPVSTLVDFIFPEDEPTVSAADLQRRTGYFSDHAYIGRAVDAYVERKKEGRIDRNEFASTLTHIDRKMTSGKDTDQWIVLLEPLERLSAFGDPRINGIPVEFVERFLNAKGQSEVAFSLSRSAEKSGASIVTMSTLRALFEAARREDRNRQFQPDMFQGTTVQNESGTRVGSPFSPPLPSGSPSNAGQTDPHPGGRHTSAEEEPVDVPLWKRFQQVTGDRPREADVLEEGTSGETPLWKQFQDPNRTTQAEQIPSGPTPAAVQPSQPTPSASMPSKAAPKPDDNAFTTLERDVLGTSAARRAMFVRELFHGDSIHYDHVIRELAKAPDWSAASRLVADQVFRSNRVDIYCEPAVAFTNAVERRYRDATS